MDLKLWIDILNVDLNNVFTYIRTKLSPLLVDTLILIVRTPSQLIFFREISHFTFAFYICLF